MTLVSLVMPVWRPDPTWLEVAVRSALDDPGPLELVLVDDGNEEPVQPPVDDPRVRVVRAAHGGPYAARDAGLAAATGTHVRFVDADDEVLPGSTSALLEACIDSGGHIAHGATEVCDEDLTIRETVGSDVRGDAVEACLLGRFTVFHVSLLYPRAVVDAAGPFEVGGFRVSGDWDFVLRALEHAPVVPVPRVVTRYRRHSASVMSAARLEEGAGARRRIIDRYFERHPESAATLRRRAYGNLHLDLVTAHAWRGERIQALRHLAAAARRTPGSAAGVALRLAAQRVRVAAQGR